MSRSHETGLEHFLFYQTLDGARDGEEFGAATLAGTGEIDAHDLLDPTGTGRHDHDVVGQVERLADAEGDEDDHHQHGASVLEQIRLQTLPRLHIAPHEALDHPEYRGRVSPRTAPTITII